MRKTALFVLCFMFATQAARRADNAPSFASTIPSNYNTDIYGNTDMQYIMQPDGTSDICGALVLRLEMSANL